MRLIWLVLGCFSLAAGVVGIFLPLLPTVPFLLLAALCFSRSSARLHFWLINHQHLGPPIRDWQSHGVISRKAKILAGLSIVSVFLISVFFVENQIVIGVQAVVLTGVSIFIFSRPDNPG